MADWKEKINKLSKENCKFAVDNYPEEIYTPQRMFATQLKWMKEKEFENQVQKGITQVLKDRYERLIANAELKGSDPKTFDATKNLIEKLKTALKHNCKGKNDEEIADEIGRDRDEYKKLLTAGTKYCFTTSIDPFRFEKAVNEFLEHNESKLDLAICGMILDHLQEMKKNGKEAVDGNE